MGDDQQPHENRIVIDDVTSERLKVANMLVGGSFAVEVLNLDSLNMEG